jgi:thioredoxin-related protein
MRIYKTVLLIWLSVVWLTPMKAQENVQYCAIEQVEQVAKTQKKKILIEVYTKWSEGFRQLERTALVQPHIVKYLNSNFVTVKFDAETRSDVVFKNKTYHYVSQSGVSFNELASELLQGQLVYPTFVFLDENMNLIQTIQYRSPDQFEMIITYFGGNNHKNMPWKKYEKTYVPMKK